MTLSSSTRFLSRLNAPVTQFERDRSERVLAGARAVLAVLSVIAVYIDPTEPTAYARITYSMLTIWVVYSLAVLGLLQYRSATPKLVAAFHAIDVLWPAIVGIFTEGPNSPFFAYFVFALASAAYRWGMVETLLTSVAGLFLLDVEALVLSGGPPQWEVMLEGQFDINRLIIRCGYLLIIAFMLGYVGETEKERRAESMVLNRILHAMRAEHGLGTSLHYALSEYLSIYRGSRAYLIVEDFSTGRAFVWQTGKHVTREAQLFANEVPTALTRSYMLSELPPTFFCKRTSEGVEMTSLDEQGLRESEVLEIPELPFHKDPVTSVLSTSYALSHQWQARLVVTDATVGFNHEAELSFARQTLQQAAPAMYSVYLVRRLRSRVGAVERARVARELHDGAIQSLISAEMQVDVMRRRTENEGSPMANDLGQVQKLLRSEVLNLRELMQQMKPVDIAPDQFIDQIADTVERFRRETGIEAEFVSDVQDVEFSPRTCRELLRVVQEGLVNVRKHAHATEALVKFAHEGGAWTLSIEDNGKGFDFDGRMEHRELLESARGPAIIKERVRAVGGELSIESKLGAGARVVVKLPQKGPLHG